MGFGAQCCPPTDSKLRSFFVYCGFGTMFFCLFVLSVCGIVGAILPGLGSIVPEGLNPLNVLYQNRCIEDIGCFYTGAPFHSLLNRPLSWPPSYELNIKFILFTPSNPSEGVEITADEGSLQNSAFDPTLPIKVLIHGYRSDLEEGDIRFQIKDALLKSSDYNVILVDWTENNGPPYHQAVANTRAVGAKLALLLKFMMETRGVRAEDIHLIGHSLGAHTAGYAGERIPNLGRITGLDPAGPYFQDAVNIVRLDATDALFVDIIHTDGGEHIVDGLGLGEPIGHMDFYPNGGRRQPGCFYASKSENAVGSVVNVTTQYLTHGCDHGRANNYFLETIDNSKCRFLATWCNSYSDFEKGDCLPQNSTLSEMGFHAKRIPGVPMKSKFFLRTNGASPFCVESSVYLS